MNIEYFHTVFDDLKDTNNINNCVVIEYFNNDLFEEYPYRYIAIFWDINIQLFKIKKKKYKGCGISSSIPPDINTYDSNNIYNFINNNINFNDYREYNMYNVINFEDFSLD